MQRKLRANGVAIARGGRGGGATAPPQVVVNASLWSKRKGILLPATCILGAFSCPIMHFPQAT